MEMSFENVPSGLCQAAESTLREAFQATQNNAIKHPHSCNIKVGQTKTWHHGRTLEKRVGKSAATLIRSQLSGTPYQWMLDLDPPNGRGEKCPRRGGRLPWGGDGRELDVRLDICICRGA